MAFNFYYDETEHSRKINKNTMQAENYYDNFITVIVGWNENKEAEIKSRYSEFEQKYNDRKHNGELKSTTLAQKQFRNGFASMSKDNLQLVSDFLDVFDENTYIYFSVESKLEYVIMQLFRGYKNSMMADMDLLRYSITKALHTYRPERVIDSIYNNPKELVQELKLFFRERIENNKGNLELKAAESHAFGQVLYLLEDVEDLWSINWDYHMPFDGFARFLEEQNISDYKLIIDEEGSAQNTLNAAFDIGHVDVEEQNSNTCFGIRMADMLAGIIAKFMKALSVALASDYSELKKTILDKKWFEINENHYRIYKKLHYVVSGINYCWYKSFAGTYADDLVCFISLLEYIDNQPIEKLTKNIDMQGEYFNGYCIESLRQHFERVHVKLPFEPVKDIEKGYFYNHLGAKVYVDAAKQPGLEIENGMRECEVLNVGVDKNMIPTVTIMEETKAVCYRIPEQLREWAQTVVGLTSTGENLFPAKVIFTKRESKWFVDIV